MALGSLNLKANKADFEACVQSIDLKMQQLQDVVNRYKNAKANLNQFMEGSDSNYDAMCERIDLNIEAASKSYAALQETKASLQQTVDQMGDMSSKVQETISSAIDATTSTINAAIKIQGVL